MRCSQEGAPTTCCGVQVGVPGTVSAIFSTVRDASANVIMISQASSEHSVCFAVKQTQGEQAVAALNKRCAHSGALRACKGQSRVRSGLPGVRLRCSVCLRGVTAKQRPAMLDFGYARSVLGRLPAFGIY